MRSVDSATYGLSLLRISSLGGIAGCPQHVADKEHNIGKLVIYLIFIVLTLLIVTPYGHGY